EDVDLAAAGKSNAEGELVGDSVRKEARPAAALHSPKASQEACGLGGTVPETLPTLERLKGQTPYGGLSLVRWAIGSRGGVPAPRSAVAGALSDRARLRQLRRDRLGAPRLRARRGASRSVCPAGRRR